MGVVGNDTESGVGCVFLYDPSQRHLGYRCHSICFVQDNELEDTQRGGIAGFGSGGEDLFRALLAYKLEYPSKQIACLHTGKCLDLLSNDVDSSIITGVQLKHHLAHVLIAVYSSRQSQNCRCLPRPWRSIEQQVR